MNQINHSSGVEAIEICKLLGFCQGSAFRHLYQAESSGKALDDLKRALWYVDYEILSKYPNEPVPDFRTFQAVIPHLRDSGWSEAIKVVQMEERYSGDMALALHHVIMAGILHDNFYSLHLAKILISNMIARETVSHETAPCEAPGCGGTGGNRSLDSGSTPHHCDECDGTGEGKIDISQLTNDLKPILEIFYANVPVTEPQILW